MISVRWQSCQSINELNRENQWAFFKIQGFAGKRALLSPPLLPHPNFNLLLSPHFARPECEEFSQAGRISFASYGNACYAGYPLTCQYTFLFHAVYMIYTDCVLTHKESCHKCIRSWYFSWPTLKYAVHYTDLIYPAASWYLSDTNRYTDCVRPDEGSLYRPFYAVCIVFSR